MNKREKVLAEARRKAVPSQYFVAVGLSFIVTFCTLAIFSCIMNFTIDYRTFNAYIEGNKTLILGGMTGMVIFCFITIMTFFRKNLKKVTLEMSLKDMLHKAEQRLENAKDAYLKNAKSGDDAIREKFQKEFMDIQLEVSTIESTLEVYS